MTKKLPIWFLLISGFALLNGTSGLSGQNILSEPSYLRFVHLVPEKAAVDFSANEYKLIRELKYGTATQWMPVWVADLKNFKMIDSASGDLIIPFGDVKLRSNRSYTLIIYPAYGDLEKSPIKFQVVIGEPMAKLQPGKSKIRFGQFMKGSKYLRMRSGDYTLFSDLEFANLSNYTSFWTAFFNDARLFFSKTKSKYEFLGALNQLRLPNDGYYSLIFFEPQDSDVKFRWMVLPEILLPSDDRNNLVPKEY